MSNTVIFAILANGFWVVLFTILGIFKVKSLKREKEQIAERHRTEERQRRPVGDPAFFMNDRPIPQADNATWPSGVYLSPPSMDMYYRPTPELIEVIPPTGIFEFTPPEQPEPIDIEKESILQTILRVNKERKDSL